MLNTVSKKSLIGKTLEEYDIARQSVSLACGGVAMETISKWCNLDSNGKPRQNISQEHLLQLVNLIKKETNVSIDPSDLLEEPDYYINQLRVVGSVNDKKVIIYHRHKKVKVDSKYPPDRSAIEIEANKDKFYYFIFDSIEYPPESKQLHNIDALFQLMDDTYIIAQNVEIGFDGAVRYSSPLLAPAQIELFNLNLDEIKCYHPITDIKIKII